MVTQKKKTVCFSIPCYNEKDNVVPMAEAILKVFAEDLTEYDCVIQFIDNCSTDGTVGLLRGLCAKYQNVRAILNARNFPQTSGYWGIINTTGDCTISIPCDFQVPLELIPVMLAEWENGAKIVCLTKTASEESGLMWQVRKLYYKLSNTFSDTELIRGFTGAGLYDKSFLDICRKIDDPIVTFLQMVVTLGYDIVRIEYHEQKRRAGKSKHSVFALMRMAVNRFTNASGMVSNIAIYSGMAISSLSFLIAIVYLVLKLLHWNLFSAGIAPILFGVFFLGGVQIMLIGFICEYCIKANQRLMHRPYVIERERLNFADTKES